MKPVADAEVSVRQAGEALKRAKTLQAKGFATKAELDNAVNAQDSARARLESAKRALFASQAQIAMVDAQKKSIDALVFTAGVGEHAAPVREAICKGLECLGLELDTKANAACQPDADVARDSSTGNIFVIATREDITMLQEVNRVLGICSPEPGTLEGSTG
jgi:acetate kinase